MSRAWMPIWWGDYLRDTRDLTTLQHGAYLLLIGHYWQHGGLPADETRLAAIAGVTPQKWRGIRAPIAAKFSPDWKHKRVDQELARADRVSMQRKLAGTRGGFHSSIARAKAVANAQAHARAAPFAAPVTAANGAAIAPANGAAKSKPPDTQSQRKITSSTVIVAPGSPQPAAEGKPPAGHKPPAAGHKPTAAQRPTEATRQDLEASFARKRARASNTGADPPNPNPTPSS